MRGVTHRRRNCRRAGKAAPRESDTAETRTAVLLIPFISLLGFLGRRNSLLPSTMKRNRGILEAFELVDMALAQTAQTGCGVRERRRRLESGRPADAEGAADSPSSRRRWRVLPPNLARLGNGFESVGRGTGIASGATDREDSNAIVRDRRTVRNGGAEE